MKRCIVLVSAFALTVSSAFAAEDAVTRAMKLYEKRHYGEAASVLHTDSASLGAAKQGAANLTLGLVYFKNAVLHRELYHSSLSVSQDYLKKLSAIRGKDRSRFVDLYFGDALMELGKPGVAALYYEKFRGNEQVEPRYRAIANVGLGLSHQLNGDSAKAAPLWSAIDTTDPELKAELAAAYSKAGLKDKNPVTTADELLGAAKKSGKPLSMRMVKNLLSVYAKAGLTGQGLDLLKRTDLKAFSYREVLGKSKMINFYDLSVLNDMATLYGQAGIISLMKAAGDPDPKVRDAAEFYLCQAQALFGSNEQSAKAAASFLSTAQMPEQYKDRVRVWQGVNVYRKNHDVVTSIGMWDELFRKRPGDPDLLAEIIAACSQLKIVCPSLVRKGSSIVEGGDIKRNSVLNIAMGRYYLGKQDNARAVAHLEAGRDKSNKNKIESNDAEMLVNLAEAYFRTKNFSEALEIYFEMSKQFPEVRQIQEAMQGVYAMEHKSAGDVKIN